MMLYKYIEKNSEEIDSNSKKKLGSKKNMSGI